MLSALVCGALVFPGLFCSSRKVLKSTFTQWSDADVVCVSERSASTRVTSSDYVNTNASLMLCCLSVSLHTLRRFASFVTLLTGKSS